MSEVSIAERVMIVTGAGQGLGAAYAREFAARGAKVVVNDVDRDGADAVCGEIAAAGGEATPAYDSVATPEGGRAIVDAALSAFGTVDGVVNNAGFMRNGYLEDIDATKLAEMLDVHIAGAYYVTQAAWPVMREKRYGRVVMVSSAGGLFSVQGQSNYSTAKAAVYGMTKALAYEGGEHGIGVNVILPMAITAITDAEPVPGYAERYPDGLKEALAPRKSVASVTPFVVFLLSEACELNGEAYSIGFGRFARVFVGETSGWIAPDADAITPEDVVAHLDEIRDLSDFTVPRHMYDEIAYIAESLEMDSGAVEALRAL